METTPNAPLDVRRVEAAAFDELTAKLAHLLLEADPSRDRVAAYVKTGECYAAYAGDRLVGVYVLVPPDRPEDADALELINIAVAEERRGTGLGRRLIEDAVERARRAGVSRLVLGTGNSSIDQIAFYQKRGFCITGVDRDFFVRNYDEPIYENGIQCRDMIRFELLL